MIGKWFFTDCFNLEHTIHSKLSPHFLLPEKVLLVYCYNNMVYSLPSHAFIIITFELLDEKYIVMSMPPKVLLLYFYKKICWWGTKSSLNNCYCCIVTLNVYGAVPCKDSKSAADLFSPIYDAVLTWLGWSRRGGRVRRERPCPALCPLSYAWPSWRGLS